MLLQEKNRRRFSTTFYFAASPAAKCKELQHVFYSRHISNIYCQLYRDVCYWQPTKARMTKRKVALITVGMQSSLNIIEKSSVHVSDADQLKKDID